MYMHMIELKNSYRLTLMREQGIRKGLQTHISIFVWSFWRAKPVESSSTSIK